MGNPPFGGGGINLSNHMPGQSHVAKLLPPQTWIRTHIQITNVIFAPDRKKGATFQIYFTKFFNILFEIYVT